MEENVALDSSKQKKFVKSIKGIKKLIKKNEKSGPLPESKKKDEEVKPAKPFSMRLKGGKITKKKRKARGLVYLSHIPHGFYEHQMTQYFKQFGVVTNARVIRSKRTGNSKGHAFVEFKEPSVAQIVAETMNNYLMGKRLIKAAYIPPEKQKRRAFRKNWNAVHNPTNIKRMKLKKAFNEDKDESGNLKKANKLLANLNKTKKRLSELGINYEFFLPVDIPEALLDKVVKKEKTEEEVKEENESKPKKGKKEKMIEQKDDKKSVIKEKVENVKQNDKKVKKEIKNENQNKVNGINKKGNQEQKIQKVENVKQKDKNVKKEIKTEKENKVNVLNKKGNQEEIKEVLVKTNKKDKKPVKVNDKQQKEKEQKLKDAGVKSVEEFISLKEEDSDESCDFDSDEYEKMLAGDDDDLSSGESDESGDADESEEEDEDDDESGDEEEDDDESGEEEEDESDEEEVPMLVKAKPVQTKKQNQKQQPQKQVKKQEFKVTNEVKRKAPQKPPVPAKKPKFEKQNQKPLKKQFKKK